MKDIIEKVLKYLPQYLLDFGALLSGPKTFIRQKNINAVEAFTDALLFLALSVMLVVVMHAPHRPQDENLWMSVASSTIIVVILVASLCTLSRIAWWLVGGRANAISYFVTEAYFYGVMFVIVGVFQLAALGLLKFSDPSLYSKVISPQSQSFSSADETLLHVFGSFVVLGFLVTVVWSFIGWGAYRQLNGLGRWRSFGAFMILGILGWLLIGIGTVLFFALRSL